MRPRFVFRVIVFVLLTLVTEIGGIAYLLSLAICRVAGLSKVSARFLCFLVVYLSFLAGAMVVAPNFGRVPLSCTKNENRHYEVASPLFCLLGRNYVTPQLKELISKASVAINQQFPGTKLVILDANFPFVDGFPLLPHLSHDDGRKVDAAFFYEDDAGNYIPGFTPSPIGYWAYVEPEADDSQPCKSYEKYNLRWDFASLQPLFGPIHLEGNRTAMVINWLASKGPALNLEKILLEPHLKNRLGIDSGLVRFQGCRAARHDDHFHFQVLE